MDIREYIASGILESYVMGLTTADESREVERLAAMHPEVRTEIEEIRLALEGYANAHAKQPPAHLKGQVLSAIKETSPQASSARVVDIRTAQEPSRSRFSTYLAIAASILLIVSIGYNYYLSQELTEVKSEAKANMEQVQHNYAALEQNMQQVHTEMAIMKDPQNKMIRLKGVENSPASLATIYWNSASKEVYLDVNNLPQAPQGMQYQLWAIVDGKPVDAGMIDMNSPGIHKMKSFDSAQAFAVTLEKAGGSPTPNLSALYVMGNV